MDTVIRVITGNIVKRCLRNGSREATAKNPDQRTGGFNEPSTDIFVIFGLAMSLAVRPRVEMMIITVWCQGRGGSFPLKRQPCRNTRGVFRTGPGGRLELSIHLCMRRALACLRTKGGTMRVHGKILTEMVRHPS